MSHICAIDALPNEVLLRVFQKLHPLSELLRYSSVCKRWKALGLQATKLTLSLSRADDTPLPPLENMRILDLLGKLKFLEWLGVHSCHWNKEVHGGGIDLAFLWVLVDKSGCSLKHLELIGYRIGKDNTCREVSGPAVFARKAALPGGTSLKISRADTGSWPDKESRHFHSTQRHASRGRLCHPRELGRPPLLLPFSNELVIYNMVAAPTRPGNQISYPARADNQAQ
jgi:hypothetical protein